ncbi:MAG TPA: hypothetical protein DC058_17300 [Planctomycetaceae bacterium]|nr:hypothetical protein [Planctomycetaceae bacterium]
MFSNRLGKDLRHNEAGILWLRWASVCICLVKQLVSEGTPVANIVRIKFPWIRSLIIVAGDIFAADDAYRQQWNSEDQSRGGYVEDPLSQGRAFCLPTLQQFSWI